MISIIVCSVRKDQLEQFQSNVSETIGVPFELISIDNTIDPKSITQVYNEGAKLAKFETLCFVHEDVAFKTKNWGQNLVNFFNSNQKAGLVGIAGCAYKPKMPTGWGCQGLEGLLIKINLIQHYKHKNQKPTLHFLNGGNDLHARVACIDGVFMATRKKVVEEIPFDNDLKGFHGYDIDFSIRVNARYEAYVAFDILLEHFSEGSFDQYWFENIIYIHDKLRGSLPLNPLNLTKKQMVTCEKRSFRFMAKFCSTRLPISTAVKILKMSVLKEYDYFTYLKMYYSLTKAYIKKRKVSF
ncbi:glycosyltransferase family protein [Belliella sp. DSM 107340]|uniref:Glycosyltransferase family protein n=1 Tax=Belliella calami TaxID=2923436 RepID=A0ABS9UIK6_9BACT|nr:glycosyltransferase [Belliella calami]MCH7396452.1 glycosyltransferase family protein [Belliella calami]